jgi:hypothetical protein
LLAGFLIAIHVMPLDVASFERAAQAGLGQPVRIGSAHLALFPLPQLRMERVAIGSEEKATIALVKASPELGYFLNDDKVFKSVELEGAQIPQRWLPVLLWGKANGHALRVERLVAKGLKLQAPGFELPTLDLDARLGAAGGLESAVVSDSERKTSVKIVAGDGKFAVEISGGPFKLPFTKKVEFEQFSGHGALTPSELSLTEFEASALGGRFSGNGRLRWSQGWSLEGEIAVRGLNAGRIAAPLVSDGRLEAKGAYSMRAASVEKLEASARLDGTVKIQKGALGTVDFTRLLQGSSATGGTTLFSELTGNASVNAAGVQLRQIHLSAGLLSAAGEAGMDARKNLNGRLQLELRSNTVQAHASVGLGGTVAAPVFRR